MPTLRRPSLFHQGSRIRPFLDDLALESDDAPDGSSRVDYNPAIGAYELIWRGTPCPRLFASRAAAWRAAESFDWHGGMIV